MKIGVLEIKTSGNSVFEILEISWMYGFLKEKQGFSCSLFFLEW
jgi:hypothetical protein